ncbi:hypothetical protein GQ600_2301 [Phytophthora cactorum]|nr:hypothetical protein GQ600_2301 [Phytophthora cactorum]
MLSLWSHRALKRGAEKDILLGELVALIDDHTQAMAGRQARGTKPERSGLINTLASALKTDNYFSTPLVPILYSTG